MDKGEKKDIQKPLSVAIVDLKKDIANAINTSGIPIYIAEMVLKEMLSEVSTISNQIREQEQAQYSELNKNLK